MLEYAFIVALIAVICIVSLRMLGWRAWSVYECAGQAIDHPITEHCGLGGRL